MFTMMIGSLKSRDSRQSRLTIVLGLVAGVVVGLLAVLAAIASGGAGHGHYVAARALFPVPMLLTFYQGDTFGLLSIVVALAQFPFYGALLAWSYVQRSYVPILILSLVHLLTAVICFSGALPNFS
jgi:hypothetical protein